MSGPTVDFWQSRFATGTTPWDRGAAHPQLQAWVDAGRSEAPHLSVSLWYALGDGAQERLRDYGYSYMRIFGDDVASAMSGLLTMSSPAALQEAVAALDELGCDELFLVPTTADVTELDRTRDALGI